MESPDQPPIASLFDAELADPDAPFREEQRRDLLGGIVTLRHAGVVAEKPLADEPLYQIASKASRLPVKRIELVLIPYYAWANRGVASMEVWLPVQVEGGKGVR